MPKLRFAALMDDGVINTDPKVEIIELDNGSKVVKVGGYVFTADAENTLSAGATLAETQRSTNTPLVYLEHGATVDYWLTGTGGNKKGAGFVRFDIHAVTGEWSVDGVAYGDTAEFRQAVLDNLDVGFHFERGGHFKATRSWTVDGESGYYAPVLVTKSGQVYVIGDANSDGTEHIRLYGQNLFGFEDRAKGSGSDFDFNDLVIHLEPSSDDSDHHTDHGGSWESWWKDHEAFDNYAAASGNDLVSGDEGNGRGLGHDVFDLDM